MMATNQGMERVLFLIGLATTWAIVAAEQPVSIALPDSVGGWTLTEPPAIYDENSLFKYIDGGAEVYRSFNVRQVVARKYVRGGAPDIIVDIFDMGTPEDAFGVYHHEYREGQSAAIGQESEYLEGSLVFWRNRYYVSIFAVEETPDAKEAIHQFGRAICAAISDAGTAPAIVGLLPRQDLLPRHIHYFHDHFCLNSYYFVAEDNIFELGKTTEGVLARYAPNPDAPQDFYLLAILKYPDAERAAAAYKKFMGAYLHDSGGESFGKTENGKYAGAKAKDDYVLVAFDAPARETAEKIIASAEDAIVKEKAKEKGVK
jgi:hypothetical protein